MLANQTHRAGRIDHDHYEPSPSTGWRETCYVLHASGGAEHTSEVIL